MEKIPTIRLQELANMLYQEQSNSLRNQISAWCTSHANNHEHAPLSTLSSMAEQSTIKDKIDTWVSNVTSPKPEYHYIPDIPAQMTDEQAESVEAQKEEIFEEEPERLPEEVVFEQPLSAVLEEQLPAEEPVVEKVKKTRKKKTD